MMKASIAAALGFAALLILAPAQAAPAQDNPASENPVEPGLPSTDEILPVNPFLRGEQTISLGAGLQIPIFIADTEISPIDSKLLLGGSFSFSYQYFISRGFALGGTIAGAFNGTIGGRSLFIAPLSFRTAYWWSALPFEFCVAAEAGGYLMRLDADGMLGPFTKAGGGAYWRVSSAWSVGLQGYFWLVPEIHTGSYSSLTRVGGFVEAAIAAVYHI
jgi:hypothetical protein